MRNVCKIDGCENVCYAYGICAKHEWRRKKYGDPNVLTLKRNICKVSDCESFCHGLGYCSKHYQKFKKYGDPVPNIPRTPHNKGRSKYSSVGQRFLDGFAALSDRECWVWTGGYFLDYGYGGMTHDGKNYKAHRFSYEHHVGPIPAGMYVCHKCDNPPCVNPSHLFLGTPNQNVQDRHSKGRDASMKGSKNPLAKLSEFKIQEIRKMLSDGASYKKIAALYQVSSALIGQVKRGIIWKHVTMDMIGHLKD